MKKENIIYLYVSAFIVVVWLGLEGLFYYIASDAQKAYKADLLNQAQMHYKNVESVRQWNADLGGIYLLRNKIASNPYADAYTKTHKEDDKYVKVTHAWMTRMLAEHHQDESYSFKLVSNNPMNPINKAENFYADALKQLQKNPQKKFSPLYELDTQTKRLQYLYPLYVHQECLECHASHGEHLGELHGGIAIDMDAGFYIERTSAIWEKFTLVTIVLTFLGGIFLWFMRTLVQKALRFQNLSDNLEVEVRSQVKKLDLALEGAGLGYWHWNIQTGKHDVDARWLRMLGLKESDIAYEETDWQARIHSQDYMLISPIIEEAIKNRHPYVVEFRMLHKDGHYVWIQGSGAVTKVDKNGQALELSGTHQDISQRKALEKEHNKNELYLQTLFEKNPNIIIVTDGKNLLKVNDAFLRFFHEYSTLAEFLKEHHCICEFFEESEFHDTISNIDNKWIEEVIASAEPIVKITHSGAVYYFAVSAKKIYEDETMYIMVSFSDITSTYKLRHKFEELSIMDALTQVYNRRFFNEMFPKEFNRAKRAEQSFCFAILDVDNFKLYNDTYGHDFGDVALQSIAKTLSQGLQRSNEFFFRLGGEEFGVIFSGYSEQKSLEYAQGLCKDIQNLEIRHSLNQPYGILTISLGLCFVDKDTTSSIKNIYSIADKALYKAKNSGRNRVVLLEGE
jgi:diguanylate cyclase (GGDEF)-like protein/PAS domain S-box-containing protein